MLGAQTVFAQGSTGLPLQCTANAGVPPVVRAEGFTELTGDLVVTCTGGNPAAPFQANIQVFLNTNITSRIVDTSTGMTEALLMIDEPGLPRTDVNGAAGTPTPFCVSPGPASNPTLIPTGSCNSTAPTQSYQSGTYTVFRGARQTNSENIIVWAGVPITPPGSNRTRTIRITNVRANAAGLGASQTLIPTQIVSYISVFPQGTLPIDNPQQTVGYVQQGLLFDVRNCGNTDVPSSTGGTAQLQCRGVNTSQFTTPTSGTIPSGSTTSSAVFALRFREAFQTAFKPQVVGATGDVSGQYNSQPGQVFNSESGFIRSDAFNTATGSSSLGTVGLANTGTRLSARFVNIPANVRLFVGTAPAVNGTALSSVGANAQLVSVTDPTGAGGTVLGPVSGGVTLSCSATSTATTSNAVEVPVTSGQATAVWEVTGSNANQNDTLVFYFGFAYVANQNAGAPALGTAQVVGNFAPFYANGSGAEKASAVLTIPRFIQNTNTPSSLFTISQCQTNLLFPFVTNQAGFDTGIAITNTSADPFTSGSPTGDPTRLNAGRCTISYYGRTANGAPPTNASETTTSDVTTDLALTMVLSSGGNYGLRGNANFQGYIIAQCNFLFAHGFAFITDGPIGQAKVAEGYLALVLDGPNTVRGNSIGESVGN